jgi:putative SOS response-associated peptidase YedK
MCYDVKAIHYAEHRRAKREGNDERAREIQEKLEKMGAEKFFHVSGFAHPHLLIYTNEDPYLPVAAQWGLIPHWTKDAESAKKFWNNTLNARGETIFEKPSFRDAAKHKRCLVYLDGFYEHHHHNGKTYPYLIEHNDKSPMAIAGLWSEWLDKETGEILKTFTLVTCPGNEMLTEIHNNPKLDGPRMPLILPEEIEDEWLNREDTSSLRDLIKPYDASKLHSHTVRPLRGKEATGNSEEADDEYIYDELNTLF